MDRRKIAVFIDFENFAAAAREQRGRLDLDAIMREIERQGSSVIRRAYADWTRFESYGEQLVEHAFELTQRFGQGAGERGAGEQGGAAGLQLMIDALETGLTLPGVEGFIFVGGDRDCSAVVRRLRAHGKHVVGIGLGQARSAALAQSCDEFLSYDDLADPDADASTGSLEEARGLLIEALDELEGESGEQGLLAASLKHGMLSLDAGFDEQALGYSQFKDFLEDQVDLVETRSIEQQLYVRALGDEIEDQDPAAAYRGALQSADLRAFEGRVEERAEVLGDLYQLLVDFPDEFSLPECVTELVARYEAEGQVRDRNLVRDIAKLLRFTHLCEPEPESYQFDPLILGEEIDEDLFLDHCESVYLAVFLEARLPIEAEVIAELLYGSADMANRVHYLAELAESRLADEGVDLQADWRWPDHLLEQPELAAIIAEVEGCHLDAPASLRGAAALAERGHAVRPKSFEQARAHFQQAARMTLELLREGRPGASAIDLETYVASYCFAAAGAHYLSYEYDRASQYYLAFFTLLDETRPVWDKMYGLVPPMLSYYFSTVLRALREPVSSSPGFTHPANMAIALYEHENAEARDRWLELVADLRRVNPNALRLVADRLTQLEESKGEEGAAETRMALAEVA